MHMTYDNIVIESVISLWLLLLDNNNVRKYWFPNMKTSQYLRDWNKM